MIFSILLIGVSGVCAQDANTTNDITVFNDIGQNSILDDEIHKDDLNDHHGAIDNQETKVDVGHLNICAVENISSSNIELADADSQSNDNKLKTVEENKTKSDIHLPKLANDTVLDIHAPKLANDAEVVIHDPISHSFEDLQKKISDTTSGDTLDLFENYKSQKGLQVEINKDLTIDGHGHILDFLGKDGHSALTQAVEISP